MISRSGFTRMNPDQFMLSLSKYISKNALRLLFLLLGTLAAGASTITGTVRNGTTNKPSSGDDVILLKLVGQLQLDKVICAKRPRFNRVLPIIVDRHLRDKFLVGIRDDLTQHTNRFEAVLAVF